MERQLSSGVQEAEDSALSHDTLNPGRVIPGTARRETDTTISITLGESALSGYRDLLRLEENLTTESGRELIRMHLSHALDFTSFEMLEAELQNQGILNNVSTLSCPLAHQAEHEGNFWRWRALRFGAYSRTFHFLVDVPRYIVWRAHELMEILSLQGADSIGKSGEGLINRAAFSRLHAEPRVTIQEELRYLDAFASYLNGAYDNSENKFQKGLNLLLKTLTNPRRVPANAIRVTMPVTREEFFSLVKAEKR